MPKRIVDGDAVWSSHKLRSVEPEWIRGEYTNLLPLALANGTFELDIDQIWLKVYGFLRPTFTRDDLRKVITSFASVGLLFIFESDRKTWGYWVGIDKPGRLPGPSRAGFHEKTGPLVPKDSLAAYLHDIATDASGIRTLPNGIQKLLGFGLGLGIGLGLGTTKEAQSKVSSSPPADDPQIFTGKHLKVTGRQDQTLGAAYPWIDRQSEYAKLDAWLEANPRRRPKGYPAFLHRCFARIQPPEMAQGGRNGKATGQELVDRIYKAAGFKSPRANNP